MSTVTLRVTLLEDGERDQIEHDDQAREIARRLSQREGVYSVTITEHPAVSFSNGGVRS